jgi:hypothetical protein
MSFHTKKRVRNFFLTLIFIRQSPETVSRRYRNALVVYGLVTCKLSLPVAGAIGLIVIV